MPDPLNVQAEIRAAEERGYFDLGLLKGTFAPHQLQVLFRELDQRKIPRQAPQDVMQPAVARTIINALRRGTVPQCDLTALSVGRVSLRRRLDLDLEEVGRGSARVRFLNAAYGAGKTHSLWLLAETAFRQNFAVSFVTLSPTECPLHSLLAVYGAIVAGVHTNESRQRRGLETLLDRWIEIIRQDGTHTAHRRIGELADYVVTALAEYAGATRNPVRPNYTRQQLLLRYLSGRHCLRRELRPLGLQHVVDESTALAELKQITLLVRHLGFRGICIFLDEAESALSFSRWQHISKAYQNLQHIVEASTDLQNCYFIYAATPSFFDTYRTYWQDDAAIAASAVYTLDALTMPEYRELAERITGIYGKSYGQAAPLEKVRLAAGSLAENTDGVGGFVRTLVAILDRERGNA